MHVRMSQTFPTPHACTSSTALSFRPFPTADNRALGHRVEPGGEGTADAIGLRVLQRVVVKGTVVPQKNYRVDAEGNVLPSP